MLDHEEGQPGDPARGQLAHGEALEGRGRDQTSRGSDLRNLEGVVETPRRARPSVGGAGEDDVARLRELDDQLGRGRRRSVRLAPVDDGLHTVTLAQQRAEVGDETVEVVLGVVEEADRATGEIPRQRGHRDAVAGVDTGRTQHADQRHLNPPVKAVIVPRAEIRWSDSAAGQASYAAHSGWSA